MDVKSAASEGLWQQPIQARTNSEATPVKTQENEEYNPIMHEDQFTIQKKKPDINYKSLIAKTLVGAAVGAGVMVLSGGSALAALGYSTAIGASMGALKGLGHAFGFSLNIGGHSGASSSIDGNIGIMTGLMGTIGAVKGLAKGAVLGALAYGGFGPLGGAVAGAVMPTVGKLAMNLLPKY
jgi:hypothetical protein